MNHLVNTRGDLIVTRDIAAGRRSASELINERIAQLGDWRGQALNRMRELIHEADPEVTEGWKWMCNPVWSHSGTNCTGESHKSLVKLTFTRGAFLDDPAKLFNSNPDGNRRRAIYLRAEIDVDAGSFKSLIGSAVTLNALVKRRSTR